MKIVAGLLGRKSPTSLHAVPETVMVTSPTDSVSIFGSEDESGDHSLSPPQSTMHYHSRSANSTPPPRRRKPPAPPSRGERHTGTHRDSMTSNSSTGDEHLTITEHKVRQHAQMRTSHGVGYAALAQEMRAEREAQEEHPVVVKPVAQGWTQFRA
jgi:hypothetical protein